MTTSSATPSADDVLDALDLPADVDVRLVVSDMDGTLLDADGEVPDAFWELLPVLRERGIVFSPASGRQYATLRRTFAHLGDHPDGDLAGMVFIAENGGYVVRDGEEISSTPLSVDLAREVVQHVRDAVTERDDLDLGVVWCGPEKAYVERTDRAFLDHVDPYYASLAEVDDLLGLDVAPVKLAVFTPGDPHATTAPVLAPYAEQHGGPLKVVVSGGHWVDVQPTTTDKGVAVRRLQETLGVSAAQTVAFGDNFNDVEMLDAATLSFAMEGAHDDVAARAAHRAPSHRDHGVVTVLRALLERSQP
ncbi:Cof-type HAD-IIB family hydrolase [Nocardioides lentus]|uniref:Cof-type HAD-IIB family hydrolase n=1 Tax=Nocardioides lentus TaxID=338077 RepID=A0ABN2NVC8_9ACTN